MHDPKEQVVKCCSSKWYVDDPIYV